MGTELQYKLNLNQEKKFSQHTLITHKYSHGSEESLLEGIEGFSPMVLEIVGADVAQIYTGKYIPLFSFYFGVKGTKPELNGHFPSGIHKEWKTKNSWFLQL